MKLSILRPSTLCLAVALIAGVASAQTGGAAKLGKVGNTTLGYGDGQLLKFTYLQNFDCIDQPTDDLNYNGIIAARDPGEMQTPICEVGNSTTINPPGQSGNPFVTTEPIFVLVPMFSVDNDQNPDDAISCNNVVEGTLCGPTLGSTLISLFGALPEAFKAKPLVYTQCPELAGAPGTCTMHASRLDLSPVLAQLGYIGNPPTANVFVPTPNHSHVLLNIDINLKPVWWQVIPVLVLDQSIWPDKAGTHGLTSSPAIQAAIQAGQAVEAPSNFFLFFGSYALGSGEHAHMH